MGIYPRYMTFSPGELERKLLQLERARASDGLLLSPLSAQTTAAMMVSGGNGRRPLVKSHISPVSFPDRITGSCRYTRGGPVWHMFLYQHGGEGTGFQTVSLPVVYWNKSMGNDLESIEAKIRELAEDAYLKAVLWEQKEYFQRASESPVRKKHPERYRMSAKRAREIGGKYAVCYRTGTGDGLIPLTAPFENLIQANAAWEERGDPRTVVGCCNRLDRCWEVPRFNPLYAQFDPRPETRERLAAEGIETIESAETESEAAQALVARTPPNSPLSPDDDWEFLPGPDGPEEEVA